MHFFIEFAYDFFGVIRTQLNTYFDALGGPAPHVSQNNAPLDGRVFDSKDWRLKTGDYLGVYFAQPPLFYVSYGRLPSSQKRLESHPTPERRSVVNETK